MKREVDSALIDRFLSIYNPDLRYLKREVVDIEEGRPVDEDYGLGFFAVPEHNVFAANHQRSPHVTESETQLMITQMMWPFFAEYLAGKGFEDLRLSYKDFFKLAKEGIFLQEEHKFYQRFITSEAGLEGRIQLMDVTKKISQRDGLGKWHVKVQTEVYPHPSLQDERIMQDPGRYYNRFEAVLVLKPGMVLERDGAK